jgi:hypothetical protein
MTAMIAHTGRRNRRSAVVAWLLKVSERNAVERPGGVFMHHPRTEMRGADGEAAVPVMPPEPRLCAGLQGGCKGVAKRHSSGL